MFVMTDKVSVSDEQIGELHRKMREIESCLGKSISHDRLMVIFQNFLDAKVEKADVRSRLRLHTGGFVTRGTESSTVDRNEHKAGMTLSQLLDTVPQLNFHDTVLQLGVNLQKKVGAFHKDQWTKHSVSVSDSLDVVRQELKVDRWSGFVPDMRTRLLFYIIDGLTMQMDIDRPADSTALNWEVFSEDVPTYFFVELEDGIGVLAVTPTKESREIQFTVSLVDIDSIAVEGAGVYLRFD
jgi:hypothetical protein